MKRIIFFDFEFTDIDTPHPQVISLGSVLSYAKDDENKSFYKVSNDFEFDKCSEFVKKFVIPILDRDEDQWVQEHQIIHEFFSWIEYIEDPVTLMCTSLSHDGYLLDKLAKDHNCQKPSNLVDIIEPRFNNLEQLNFYRKMSGKLFDEDRYENQHNALIDSQVLRKAYMLTNLFFE